MSPKNGMSEISGRCTFGIRSTSGVPDEPISDRYAKDVTPSARMLIAVPEMIWFAPRWIEKKAWMSADSAARRHRRREPDRPRERLGRGPEAPEAPHQHHALDGDVGDAGALREDAAEAAQHERRREPQGRCEQAGRDDVLDRPRVGVREQRAARRRRSRRRTAPVRRAGPRPGGWRRRRARPRCPRTPAARSRCRARIGGTTATMASPAETMPGLRESRRGVTVTRPAPVDADGDGGGGVGASVRSGRGVRRRNSHCSRPSPPTKRMTAPWMMVASARASSAGISPDSCRAPESRPANSSAARMMPTGWLRPSSATAMPVKPSVTSTPESVFSCSW